MNSRERLLCVLEGRMPDRVPVSTYELCARNSYSFENREPSYRSMMALIKEKTDAIAMWNLSDNGRYANSAFQPTVTEETYEEKGYHVTHTVLHTPGRELSHTAKRTDDVMTVWNVEHLCKDTDDVDTLMALPFEPVHYSDGDYPRISREVGEEGIIMASLADPICIAMELMDFGEATVWALTEPNHFQRTLDELHRRGMINLRASLETRPVDLYRICGPEYATPPYLSPAHFRRFVYPYLCDMVSLIQSYGSKARIHSHGRIGQVLDMIIDTGADAIDPCEGPPDGDVSLAEVKAKTGGRMCIFGNLQLKLLEHARPSEVATAVRDCMAAAKEGGRYVIMPTASPINLPLSPATEENYRVFIETALSCGVY